MRIALDAMGCDYAPGPIVAGAVEAVRDREDLTVLLVGDKPRIEIELAIEPFPTALQDVWALLLLGMRGFFWLLAVECG